MTGQCVLLWRSKKKKMTDKNIVVTAHLRKGLVAE